jgi:hypothetical protein
VEGNKTQVFLDFTLMKPQDFKCKDSVYVPLVGQYLDALLFFSLQIQWSYDSLSLQPHVHWSRSCYAYHWEIQFIAIQFCSQMLSRYFECTFFFVNKNEK